MTEMGASFEAGGGPAGPRRMPAGLLGDLRPPLEAVGRALQRLSLQGGATEPDTDTLARLRRARLLVTEVQEIVEEILAAGEPEDGPVARARQETVALAPLLDAVAADAAEYAGSVPLVVECLPDLVVTTHAERLRQIGVNLVAGAARRSTGGGVTIVGRRNPGFVELRVSWHDAVREPGHADPLVADALGLPLARALARGLGATVRLAHDTAAGALVTVACVTLPQQRTRDGAESR